MTSVFPTGLDTLATNKGDSTPSLADHSAHHNDIADAVNRLERAMRADIDLELIRQLHAAAGKTDGFKACNFSPTRIRGDDTFAVTNGRLVVEAIYVPEPMTLTGIMFFLKTAMAGQTIGAGNEMAFGLFTSDGTTLSRVRSVTSAAANFQAPLGLRKLPFADGTLAGAQGLYWAAMVTAWNTAGTVPEVGGCVVTDSEVYALEASSATGYPRSAAWSVTTMPSSRALTGTVSFINKPWLAVY